MYILYIRRQEGGGGGRRQEEEEDGMPLVETTAAGNGAVCRAGSCTEDPQVYPLRLATFVSLFY